METVAHHGRETAYVTSDGDGDDAAVLLVHGSGASRDIWYRQLDGERSPGGVDGERSDGFAALDLSGHGDSDDVDATPGYATLSAYADDVLAVADTVDARVIAGHSLGGAVLMHALLDRSPDLDGVVLAGTGARLGVLEDLLRWLDDDFDRAIEFLHGEDRFFHDPEPADRELSMETMRDCGRAVTRRDFRTCHRFDVRDRLGEIDVPALAVCGEHDRLTPPWFHEYLTDEIPDAELIVCEDAAQLTMLERPGTVTDAIASFARAVGR